MTFIKPEVWIITGGLDKGVDQLIGEEVKAKLKTEDKNLQAVLGICSWGCLGDKKSFLNVIYLSYFSYSLKYGELPNRFC